MAEPASLGLERRNPLPKGRYWVFRVGARQIVDFDDWLRRNRPLVRLVATDLDPGERGDVPQNSFNVFEVLRDGEVTWEGPGLPDRSPPHVTSRQDVERAPVILDAPERVRQGIEDAANAVKRGAETIPLLLFLAGVAYLLTQKERGSREVYD
jgi:hypothetical protein